MLIRGTGNRLLTAVLICVQDLKSSHNWKTGGRKPSKIPELPYLKCNMTNETSSTKEINPDNNSYDLSGNYSVPCKTQSQQTKFQILKSKSIPSPSN